ncbi:MAG: DUF2232 domain-containing protein [Proteobacteria bacterium]|nr:DUF2232 domain-containing protein [Pseudomonadota bacterium]
MSVKRIVTIYLLSAASSIILFQSVFLSMLTPCPQIFCYLRLGRWAGLSLPLFLFIAFSFLGQKVGLGYLLQFGILGVLISESIYRRYSVEKSFILSVSVVVVLVLLLLGHYASTENLSTGETVKMFTEKVIGQSISLNERAGMSVAQVKALKDLAPAIGDVLSQLYPSLLVVAVLITLWLNVMVLSRIFLRMGLDAPFRNLSSWKAPEPLVWAVVLSGISFFVDVPTLKVIGMNLLVVLFTIYFFQGMAIISFYFNKKKVAGLLKGFLYVLIVWYLGALVALVGLFDTWADFRKLSKPKDSET